MQRRSMFNYSQHFLKTGYKELSIPANPDGTHKLNDNSQRYVFYSLISKCYLNLIAQVNEVVALIFSETSATLSVPVRQSEEVIITCAPSLMQTFFIRS